MKKPTTQAMESRADVYLAQDRLIALAYDNPKKFDKDRPSLENIVRLHDEQYLRSRIKSVD